MEQSSFQVEKELKRISKQNALMDKQLAELRTAKQQFKAATKRLEEENNSLKKQVSKKKKKTKLDIQRFS
jgi:hypothetical protein